MSSTLHRSWPLLEFIRPPKEHKLPAVLSVDEVQQHPRLCAPAPLSRLSHHHLCLRAYASAKASICVLRRSISGRMVIHIQAGKGGKDRYVPLAPQL